MQQGEGHDNRQLSWIRTRTSPGCANDCTSARDTRRLPTGRHQRNYTYPILTLPHIKCQYPPHALTKNNAGSTRSFPMHQKSSWHGLPTSGSKSLTFRSNECNAATQRARSKSKPQRKRTNLKSS
jgi:hypothetical protein